MAISFGSGGPKVGAGIGFGGGVKKFGEVPDPLADVEYTDDLAADTSAECDALQKAYKDRRSKDAVRFRAATDSEYWFAVCFQSREEKEAFLAEFGAGKLGDKYIDGAALARLLRRERVMKDEASS